MAVLVGLYAGHGVSTNGLFDPGCVYKKKGKTYTEADLVLAITKYMVHYAKRSGINVTTDATTGNKINMIRQIQLSNAKGCDVHIAIHCDWKEAGSGTRPLYLSPEGRKLAVCLNKAVIKDMNMKTFGVDRRTDLAELNETNAVACIFECGSIKADLKKMQQAKKYGKALAKGLCNYLGVKFKSN